MKKTDSRMIIYFLLYFIKFIGLSLIPILKIYQYIFKSPFVEINLAVLAKECIHIY